MEKVSNSSERQPFGYLDAADAARKYHKAIVTYCPDLTVSVGIAVGGDDGFKVAIRLIEESDKDIAIELAEIYIPGVPIDIVVAESQD